MNREEQTAIHHQWTEVLSAVESTAEGISAELDMLSRLATAQGKRDSLGFDLECSVDRIRSRLTSLNVRLQAAIHVDMGVPSPAEEQPVLIP